MATIVAYFNSEAEAHRVLQQLALETSVQSIVFLNQSSVSGENTPLDSLVPIGLNKEQSAIFQDALSAGKAAVALECNDAADMLVALQNYGVREYSLV
ncbi:hypothetical protein [Brevibacillus sp. H7]|uniref:hypothetical protein n=1 Tax=Brevibacillus sp. H7 TaxID=3349138 RepID=UPI00382E26E4